MNKENRVAEDIPFIDVNPLDEPVNEKRYTQPNINTTGIDLNAPIEEPSFTPPPFKKPNQPGEKPSGSSGSSSSGSSGGSNNGADENLSKKDLRVGAEAAADMTISMYEWLHVLGNKGLQISQKRLQRMQDEGTINLQAMIDYDENHRITAGEFIEQYNQQVSNVLTVSDEFKSEIRPLLIELYIKKGVKVTLEQRIAAVVAKDLAAKLLMTIQQLKQTKMILQTIAQATVAQQPQPQPQPQPAPAPAPTPQPQPEPEQPEVIVVEPEEFEVDNKALVKSERKPRKYEI
jgi:hypothetical protein